MLLVTLRPEAPVTYRKAGLISVYLALTIGPAAMPAFLQVDHAAAARVRALAAGGDLYDPALVRRYMLTFGAGDWETALRAAGDTGNVAARLEVDDQVLEQVGVRYKGLSSMLVRSRKKPLNVTTDVFVPGQRLRGYDVVNLNNGYSDPSFVREALITEMLRQFMPSQQTAYARVDVNGGYFGLYLAVEQVEGTFISEWFPESDGILIKCDPPAGPGMGARTFHSALEWEGEDLEAYRPLYEVKTGGAEEEGLVAIREAARLLDAPVSMGGATDEELVDAVPQILDVDRALWYLAANNLFVNYDSYYFGHNYFLYLAEEDGLLHLLLWDTSLAFGGLDLGTWGPRGGSGTQVDPFALAQSAERPVIRRLLAIPDWRADYVAHYRALLDHAFDPNVLAERGTQLQALARPGLETDPNRLFSLSQFERNLYYEVATPVNMGPGGKSPGVVDFARDRNSWLRTLPELAPPDHRLAEHSRVPDAPRHDQGATVTLRFEGDDEPTAVRIVYRVDGGRPVAIELQPTGDVWRGTIPSQPPGVEVTYYARVALTGNRSAFHPIANLVDPWRYTVLGPDLPVAPPGDLVINELMADNESTLADEAGEFDDWLELHNRGASPIDLAGLYLSDDPDNPWAFPLPEFQLAPGSYLVVWCDSDPEQGALHAPFGLARAGESAVLSTDESILDQVDFGPQDADISLARVPDGGEEWYACQSPTPGDENRCSNVPQPSPTGEPTPAATVTPSPTPAAAENAFLPALWN